MAAEQREASYAIATTAEVPRPRCGRCEDWTTVIHKNNVISPCPVCRPEEFSQWQGDGNRLPDGATAA